MICPKCKKKLTEGSKFCTFCGKKNSDYKMMKIITVACVLVIVLLTGSYFGYQQIKFNKSIQTFVEHLEKRDFNKAKDYYQSKSSDEKFVSKAENAYQELYFQYIDSVEIEKACALFNSEIVEAEEFTKKVQEAAIKNMETQREKFIEKSIKYNAVQGIVQNYCVFKDEVISKKPMRY